MIDSTDSQPAIGGVWRRSVRLVLVLASVGLPQMAQAQNVGLASQIGLGCQFPTINDALSAAAVGDTVLVAEGITLTESVTVDLDVAIRSATSTCNAVSAPFAPKPILKAPPLERALVVEANRQVAVKQMVVQDGDAGLGDGGNILVKFGANLLLDDVIVQDGTALRGGGVYVRDATLRIRNNSSVLGNQADEGGGIYVNSGTLNVVDSIVGSNAASLDGGGIYADDATIALVESSVQLNQAKRDGGGLFLFLSGLVSDDVLLTSNDSVGDGGGLFARSSTLEVDLGDIVLNESEQDGGGIYADACYILKLKTSFRVNRADRDGGGLMVVDESGPSTARIDGTELENNLANQDGGGLLARGTQFGVFLDGSPTISDNVVGRNGGGASLQQEVTWMDPQGVIADNVAGEDGGGLHINGAFYQTAGPIEIVDNRAERGGGVAVDCVGVTQPVVVLGQAHIAGNTATGDGGGIAFWNSPTPSCEMSLVAVNLYDNSASGDGGGVALWGNTTLDTSELWAHRNAAENGGAIAALNDAAPSTPRLLIRNNSGLANPCTHRPGPLADQYCVEFRDNDATLGAGIYLEDAVAIVEQAGFLGNDATGSGSAIELAPWGSGTVDVQLANAVFADNNAALATDVVHVDSGASLDATSVAFGLNGGAPLHWDFGSSGSLFNSAVSDITPIEIDAALGALPADCNAVNAVVGALGGSFYTGLVFGDFTTSVPRGRFQVDATTTPLHDQCTSGPSEDIDRNARPGGSGLWDRGAFEAP